MATGKICDMTGTAKGVKTYEVTVSEITETGSPLVRFTKRRDYGPRGYDRLIGFIESGLRKPGEAKEKVNAVNA